MSLVDSNGTLMSLVHQPPPPQVAKHGWRQAQMTNLGKTGYRGSPSAESQ